MKVKILKKEKNELKIELDGEDHTLGNLIQSTLLEDDGIEMAGYDLPHPLSKKPIIYIRTKGSTSPKKSLEKALTKISKRADEFISKFAKAVEK